MLTGGIGVLAQYLFLRNRHRSWLSATCAALVAISIILGARTSYSATVTASGVTGAFGVNGSPGNPGTVGGNGSPGNPDPTVANTGLSFDPTNTATAHGGNGGSGGNGGNGVGANASGGNGGNGGKGSHAQATVITNPGLAAPVVANATATGGNGGTLGLGGTATGAGSPGSDGVSGVGGDAFATASGSGVAASGVDVDSTARGGTGGVGSFARASDGATGGFAQAVAVGTGATGGANQFSITSSATGGDGGQASPLGGNGGKGGSAVANSNGDQSGAAIAAVTATAIGGAGGAGNLPGQGGDATATIIGAYDSGIAAVATATGGSGPGAAVNGAATARAQAMAPIGSAAAQSISGGALTPFVSATAFAPVSSTTLSESHANVASAFVLGDPARNSGADVTGSPLGADVTSVVAGNPHSAAMTSGADILGLFHLSGAYPNGAIGTRTYISTAALIIDLTQVSALRDLQLAVVDASSTGLGFDSLRLEVSREGVPIIDQTYTNSSLASALFQDSVFNFGDIETGIGDNMLDVMVNLSVTTNDVGAGFGAMFVLANSALPEWDADFDNDTDVDGTDLSTWNSGYGVGLTHAQGDADHDGDVDGSDFLIWQRQYTGPPIVAAVAAVPEPAPGLMVLLAVTASIVTRHKATGLQPRGFGC